VGGTVVVVVSVIASDVAVRVENCAHGENPLDTG